MDLDLYQLTPEDSRMTIEGFYQKNKEKYSLQNNIVEEGDLIFEFGKNKLTTKAFVAKNGFVVIEDWDMAEEALMSVDTGDLYIWDKHANIKYPVYISPESREVIDFICDHPEVEFKPSIKKRLDEVREELKLEQAEPEKNIKPKI
jgi:hypothetical protein